MLKWPQRWWWRWWWQRQRWHSLCMLSAIIEQFCIYTHKMKQLDHLECQLRHSDSSDIFSVSVVVVDIVVHYATTLIGMAKRNSLCFLFLKRFDCLYWKWNWSNSNFDQSIEHSRFSFSIPIYLCHVHTSNDGIEAKFKWYFERGGDLHFELNCTSMCPSKIEMADGTYSFRFYFFFSIHSVDGQGRVECSLSENE